MSIELTALIGISGVMVGMILGYLNFRRDCDEDIKKNAYNDAEIKTQLTYILKILKEIQDDINNKENRIVSTNNEVIIVKESVATAHKRIDETNKRVDCLERK